MKFNIIIIMFVVTLWFNIFVVSKGELIPFPWCYFHWQYHENDSEVSAIKLHNALQGPVW